MSTTDRDRRELFTSLETAIGTKPANTFMELLPRQPADELVTRSDMHAFGSTLRADVRSDMTELRAALRGEMADLRTELRVEMASLRGEMNRWMGRILAANGIAVVTALLT